MECVTPLHGSHFPSHPLSQVRGLEAKKGGGEEEYQECTQGTISGEATAVPSGIGLISSDGGGMTTSMGLIEDSESKGSMSPVSSVFP